MTLNIQMKNNKSDLQSPVQLLCFYEVIIFSCLEEVADGKVCHQFNSFPVQKRSVTPLHISVIRNILILRNSQAWEKCVFQVREYSKFIFILSSKRAFIFVIKLIFSIFS